MIKLVTNTLIFTKQMLKKIRKTAGKEDFVGILHLFVHIINKMLVKRMDI